MVRQNGQFAAFLNVCQHLKRPLNLDADDFMTPDWQLLRCVSHGALYVPTTGICVAGPCAGQNLTKLSCWVEDGTVVVLAPASMRELDALTLAYIKVAVPTDKSVLIVFTCLRYIEYAPINLLVNIVA